MDRADQNPEVTESREGEIILIDTDGDSEAEAALLSLDGTHGVAIVENAEGAPEIIIIDLDADVSTEDSETAGIIVIDAGESQDSIELTESEASEAPGAETVIPQEVPSTEPGDGQQMPGMGSEALQEAPATGSEAGQMLPGMGSEASQEAPGLSSDVTGSGSGESLAAGADYSSPSTEDAEAEQKSSDDASEQTSEEQQADAEAQAHIDSATLAQQHADEDIQKGDYAAASQEREAAENEAWQGGDSSMLHGSDSTQLEHAADDMKEAGEHEALEAKAAEEGDYRTARDEAANAENDTSWSDFRAGGPDHTGQAQAEYEKEDWAVWHQDHADSDARSAEQEASEGDFEHAQQYAASAASEQEKADTAGYEGMHGADGAVHDPSSDVASGTPVDDHSVVVDADSDTEVDAGSDASDDAGYDAGADSGGYDAGASGSSYDAGTSDSSSYDAGTSDTSCDEG